MAYTCKQFNFRFQGVKILSNLSPVIYCVIISYNNAQMSSSVQQLNHAWSNCRLEMSIMDNIIHMKLSSVHCILFRSQ